MERPNILEIKVDTNKEVLRPMTDDEYAQFLKDQAEAASERAKREVGL